MGINGGRGIVGSGSVLGGSGISLAGGGEAPFSFGNALKPDGFNDIVSLSGGGIVVGNNDFTLSFWFKANWNFGIKLFTGVGSIAIIQSIFSVADTFAGRNFIIPTQPNDTWFHIMFAFDFSAQKGRTYINGVESSTGEITVRLNNCTFDELINQDTPGAVRDFTIDEILIYRGYKGTISDAIALYNGGNGQFPSVAIPSQTPLSYWRCNEANGALTLVDEQGNFDGTLTNFSRPPEYFVPH